MISFRINCFDLLAVKGHSRVFSSPTGPKHQHDCRKNHSCDYTDLFGKVMSLLFNMLSRLVIAFLPRSKSLLIPWLQSPSAVTTGKAQSNPDRNWKTHILSLPGDSASGKKGDQNSQPSGPGFRAELLSGKRQQMAASGRRGQQRWDTRAPRAWQLFMELILRPKHGPVLKPLGGIILTTALRKHTIIIPIS